MPLTYDATKVFDWKKNYPFEFDQDGESNMNPVTETLIFTSMSTGIPEITTENAEEVFTRIRMLEMLYGPMVRVPGPARSMRAITLEDVENHVGLKTNTVPITQKLFNNTTIRSMRRIIKDN